jgi:hypothetical protein
VASARERGCCREAGNAASDYVGIERNPEGGEGGRHGVMVLVKSVRGRNKLLQNDGHIQGGILEGMQQRRTV